MPRRILSTASVVGVVAGLAALGLMTAPSAGAAVSTTLVYSIDGGTTWVTNPTVPAGSNVLVRLYYNNDTSDSIAATQLSTSLPAGFSLVAGSTKVCLNPGTTDPTNPSSELECNTNTGGTQAPDDQGGAINEAAVWSGNTLTISPTAGLFGQPVDQTSGPLAEGMAKYLNLDQCVYTNSTTNNFTSFVPLPGNPNFSAGTNASNTATATSCGPGGGGYTPQGGTGVANYSLLGQAYFNLNQCYYTSPVTAWVDPGTGGSNTDQNPTNADNFAPCSGSVASNSGILSMGLLDNQYINLDECTYQGPTQTFSSAIDVANSAPEFDAGSNASTSPQAIDTCGAGISGWTPNTADSGVLALNYLDTTRGQGFVQFTMAAPSPTSTITEPQTGTLTGTGTGNPMTTDQITVAAVVGAPLADSQIALLAAGAVGCAGLGLWLVRRRRGNEASR